MALASRSVGNIMWIYMLMVQGKVVECQREGGGGGRLQGENEVHVARE